MNTAIDLTTERQLARRLGVHVDTVLQVAEQAQQATGDAYDEDGNLTPEGVEAVTEQIRVTGISVEDLTVDQVQALATEAGAAGDAEMVAICERAVTHDRHGNASLSEDEDAIDEVLRVVNEARATTDEL